MSNTLLDWQGSGKAIPDWIKSELKPSPLFDLINKPKMGKGKTITIGNPVQGAKYLLKPPIIQVPIGTKLEMKDDDGNPISVIVKIGDDEWVKYGHKVVTEEYPLNYEIIEDSIDKEICKMQIVFEATTWKGSGEYQIQMPQEATILDCFVADNELRIVALYHEDTYTTVTRWFKAVAGWEGGMTVTNELAYVGIVSIVNAPSPPTIELSVGGMAYTLVTMPSPGFKFWPDTTRYVLFEVMNHE